MTKVVVELPPDEAMALAQMVKRLAYDDAERLSSRYDGGAERDSMRRATTLASMRRRQARLSAVAGLLSGPHHLSCLFPRPSSSSRWSSPTNVIMRNLLGDSRSRWGRTATAHL
jgi:hypothetical protein